MDYRYIKWERPPLRTFYASPHGGGNGTSRSRPRAFNKLLPTLRAGDRVILLLGNYPSARLSLQGTATRPIRIEAEHPIVRDARHTVAAWKKVVFRNTGLQISKSAYVRIKGLSFHTDQGRSSSGIEVLSGRNLAFVQNQFLQNSNYGLLFFGKKTGDVAQVLVEGNVFRSMISGKEPGGIGRAWMDYGLRIHGTDTLVARNNLFDGYFNHAVSVKEMSRDILIERNKFNICSVICVEAGQEPDTAAGGTLIDRTVVNVNIRNNVFNGRNDGSTGVFARNVERAYVTGNAFNRIARPLRIANNDLNSRSCERQLQVIGRMLAICEHRSRLTLTGRRNRAVLFEKNRVRGKAAIYVTGRGYKGDFLSIRDTSADTRVPVVRRSFVVNKAAVNAWTKGAQETLLPPQVYLKGSGAFYLQK
ncbi:right-handed parallel beta-helix repeat-containing protein [Geminicoccus roseus]|uniref:right-handed parallel beta-helix repeat-containing protein n=1 Tax=Geminicoccus roseus TaxID=404900 RepID=UPI00041F7428|nr:right-handed parallel beta-helix repeat-containing protein [Geminicoccus roseus]